MSAPNDKAQASWWSWDSNRDSQFLIAEKLGFHDKCNNEANKRISDVYNDCPLTVYYGAFAQCFDREMAHRFKDE